MQFSRATSHLPEPDTFKSSFYFSFPRYQIIDLKIHLGKVFWGYEAFYNPSARILTLEFLTP